MQGITPAPVRHSLLHQAAKPPLACCAPASDGRFRRRDRSARSPALTLPPQPGQVHRGPLVEAVWGRLSCAAGGPSPLEAASRLALENPPRLCRFPGEPAPLDVRPDLGEVAATGLAVSPRSPCRQPSLGCSFGPASRPARGAQHRPQPARPPAGKLRYSPRRRHGQHRGQAKGSSGAGEANSSSTQVAGRPEERCGETRQSAGRGAARRGEARPLPGAACAGRSGGRCCAALAPPPAGRAKAEPAPRLS